MYKQNSALFKMVSTRVLFLVFGLFCVECAVLRGRALLCRDPDSGKLYPMNSTWASTTFCGNYTCKLRRRNMTQMEFVPLRTFNVTYMGELDRNTTNSGSSLDNSTTIVFETRAQSEITPVIHKNIISNEDNIDINKKQNPGHPKKEAASSIKVASLNNNIQKHDSHRYKNTYEMMNRNNDAKPQLKETISSTIKNIQSDAPVTDHNPDRYLTENEIKTISDMLHTVKKSDLDALVDIYNLAQDIYNEMDKATNKNLIDETINEINDAKLSKFEKPTSYWYEPLVNKGRVSNRLDMDFQGTDSVMTTTKSREFPSYYNSALWNNRDYTLPFYYPISDFQRLTSYVPVSAKSTEATKASNIESKPCNTESVKPTKSYDNENRLIRPSYLLPYPFSYINHYNKSEIPTFYYNSPWKYDYYNRYRYYQPYYNAFIAPIPTTQSEEIQGFEQESVETFKLSANKIKMPNEKPDFKPAWKTSPISSDVLEGIRAKVDTSKLIKALPLRKLVKLERVVKVEKINEDEHLLRNKREIESYTKIIGGDDEEYETYLEKITCKPQTVPGFFRFGNLTQPFPNCCPQLILDKDKL